MVLVGILYNLVPEQIVLHIGIGQIVREHAQQVLGIVECVLPGCIVVPELASFVRRHITVFLYVCL